MLMQARVELSALIRKKEGIPGGKEGMKKLAKIINDVMEKAGVTKLQNWNASCRSNAKSIKILQI